MKFNISYPLSGAQKCVEIDDDKKCSIFYDKKIGAEVAADQLGEEFHGYVFKITGGNDKQGFPMKQGVLVKGRVRLLVSKGHSGYRPRRTGERKRKSVRGCIVGSDLRVLSLAIIKKGEKDIEGVTDTNIPRRLGPKRATKIRRLFALKKTDNVALIKKNVVRRTWTAPNGKQRQKAPKIQRLVTEDRLRRKKNILKAKKEGWIKTKKSIEEYNKLVTEWKKKKAASHKKEVAEKKEKVPEKKPVAKGTEKKSDKPADKKKVATQPAKTQPKQTATTTKDKKPAEKPSTAKTTTAPKKDAPKKEVKK